MINSLTRIFAVFKREFFSLLGSAAAWVFLVIFLALSGVLTFVVSDILSQGQADLSPFFNWMPVLFLFVIPALAMPLWSEERRLGTLELSLSYPIRISELVAGKFFAGLALLLFALLLTVGTPLTVAFYGKPDVSAILCGYLGAIMAGAVFLAVSCFCSALTKSQTASFLLSLMFCFLLIFTGFDRIAAYLSTYLPESVCLWIERFSVFPHYQAFQRGLIDSSEIAYALLMTLLFLYLTTAALRFSSSGIGSLFLSGTLSDSYTWRQIGHLATGIVIAFYVYSCLIFAGGTVRFRIDATADKAYSLTEQSKKIAGSLERVVDLRLYISGEKTGMPPPLKQYGQRVEWLLREFVAASKGKIRFTVVRLEEDSREEEEARMDGLQPVSSSETGERYYLGLVCACGTKVLPIKELIPEREATLEYELVRTIKNVSRTTKPVVGIMSALPVLGTPPKPGEPGNKPLTFATEIAADYTLKELSTDIAFIPDNIDVLVVFQPSDITPRALYALDQYLMHGGRAVILLDPNVQFLPARTARERVENMNKRTAGLGGLLPVWGVSYDRDSVVGDMNFKFSPAPNGGVLRVLPTVLDISSAGINSESTLTASLTRIFMASAGAFQVTTPVKGLNYDVLVHTTTHSGLFPSNAMDDQIFADFAQNPNAANGVEYPLVLEITGVFPSAFEQAPDASAMDSGHKHLAKSTGSPAVVLFGDCDMLFKNANKRYEQDDNGQIRQIAWNDNMTLFTNVLEKLCGDENMAQLRTRKPMSRPLVKIQQNRKNIEAQFADKYRRLVDDFTIRSSRVQAIRRKLVMGGGKIRLSMQEKTELDEFSKLESDFRRECREMRNQLKTGRDSINRQARILNIFVIPAAVILLGIVWGIARRFMRRRRV